MTELRDVVIPAGGYIPDEYARIIGTPFRALAPIGPERHPVMQIVVNALRASGMVRRIIGVAAEPVAAAIGNVDQWLAAGESGANNILRGLAAFEDSNASALVCASDLPLIMPEDVSAFVSQCRTDVDVTLGIVRAAAYEAAFLGAPPSQWVALRDAGPVTLGCLFGIRPALLINQQALLTSVFESRKSQWRMARLLGPRLLWQWGTKRLTLQALVARGETILGGRAQILRNAPPRLSFDIDTADDYTYADTSLRQPGRAGAARPV